MQDLFGPIEADDLSHMPLAARMRPRNFEEFVGQAHILGPGRVLRRSIEADRLSSMIFWGPPGCGKTALARVIANVSRAQFIPVSAVTAGVADLRRAVEDARKLRRASGRRTILFIDEIHRFNKAQQDAILPHVEDGTVILIGATTENPSFEVNSALLSRTRVFVLNALTPAEIETVVRRALSDEERGLGRMQVHLPDEALQHLIASSNGDARIALNALELAVSATPPDDNGERVLSLRAIEDALQHKALAYDRAGDQHYDTISAYIKSVRGSDPDAAVYWLARMLDAGEDPLFIARRMVILAAEDIGLADPQALVIAVAAQQAVHFIGMPEGLFPLTEATIYLATAPKSNSAYQAYSAALEDVKATGNQPVPLHLRNAATGLMRSLGYGRDYKYAHSYPGHYVEQQYLPDSLSKKRYYTPTGQGFEQEIAERIRRWRAGPAGGRGKP
ncbi:MAG: replication-associated recombination protein A [Bacteroidetes bacterium]|nr:replication-associated recombination protein A [Bacteroidota bacterium]MCL5025575.1 replication-associated recombination protein A [Chloroflexota bacterium]